ncbi:MAG: ABC transporter ATP-binding protein [Candidatus Methanoperedens sp.]|nr:ABC transporter ATP-binding protein [Candidatus Methanoperedens sp.]
MHLIRLNKVTKTHEGAGGTFHALREIDLQVEPREFVAIIGKSGSGKSTLLNMLGGIDSPTSGEIWIGDTPVHTLDQDALAKWRGRNVGFVFQFFQLLPTLTILENVMLPMDFSNAIPARERIARALGLLEQVGIREQADKLPALLSGGQQQRAAIARALANDPALLLADEPTGNLDSRTAEAILLLFKGLAASGKTIVMVTHERDITPWVSSVVKLADGRVVNGSETP